MPARGRHYGYVIRQSLAYVFVDYFWYFPKNTVSSQRTKDQTITIMANNIGKIIKDIAESGKLEDAIDVVSNGGSIGDVIDVATDGESIGDIIKNVSRGRQQDEEEVVDEEEEIVDEEEVDEQYADEEEPTHKSVFKRILENVDIGEILKALVRIFFGSKGKRAR